MCFYAPNVELYLYMWNIHHNNEYVNININEEIQKQLHWLKVVFPSKDILINIIMPI